MYIFMSANNLGSDVHFEVQFYKNIKHFYNGNQ